jgi:hypothetical protein
MLDELYGVKKEQKEDVFKEELWLINKLIENSLISFNFLFNLLIILTICKFISLITKERKNNITIN